MAVPRVQAPRQHLQVCEAASLQFIKGVNESTVPDVALRRARTGTSGQAMFTFENPSIFQASSELGDITGVNTHLPFMGIRGIVSTGSVIARTILEPVWARAAAHVTIACCGLSALFLSTGTAAAVANALHQ